MNSSDSFDMGQLSALTATRIVGLLAVTDSLAESLTPAQVSRVVMEQGVTALGARAGSVALLTDDGQLELVSTVGYPEELVAPYRRFPLNTPLPISEAVRTGQPVFLETWEQWSSRYPSENRAGDTQRDDAWAALPLVAQGQAIGAIGLSFSGSRTFSEDDKAFMQTLCRHCAQAMGRARLYEATEKARAAAEATERRMALLAKISAALADTLNYHVTLAKLAELTVPSLADWCAVDMLTEEGELERLAVAHIDPAKVQWGREIQRRYPPDPAAATGVYNVLRTGRPEFYPDIPDELLVAAARDEGELAILRHIGFRSVIVMPLVARGRTLGAMTFVTTSESGRTYDAADVTFAGDVTGRAAIAVDNARLYRGLQRSERHKEETLAQLEAVLADSPAGFGFVDCEFRFIRVNDTLARVNGLPVEKHIGRFIWEVIGERQWAYRRQYYERALAGESVLNVDISELLPGHSPFSQSLMASYFPVRREGEVIGVGAVFNDITERKRAEETIRESEQRFRLMADTAPVMIWMSGTDALCFYFNKPWLDFTGRTLEQEMGNGWTEGIHPDDRDRCLATYSGSFQARKPFEIECRLRDSDGQYRWIMDIGSPRFTPDGGFIGYIGSCIDITDRKRVEQVLLENEARQRAFLTEILSSVTEGKLRLCDRPEDLPPRLRRTGEPILLSVAVLSPIRQAACQAAISLGFSEARTQDLVTAVGEAAMNAAVHAGGGAGEVCSADDTVQVWIVDNGAGIDVQRLPRATLERGFTTAGSLGHGFWIMLRTADTVWLRTGPDGTTIVIEQHKKEPEVAWLQMN